MRRTMFNPDAKPRRNPSTGCAHITNYEHPAFGFRRCCSYCYAPQPKDIDEELLKTFITNLNQFAAGSERFNIIEP